MSTPLRILFLGENWFGSCARACCYALRRMGHDVLDVDAQVFFPRGRSLPARAALRLLAPDFRRQYNRHVLDAARTFAPDFLLAFKGTYLDAATLRELRGQGIALYNYFPDRMALFTGTPLRDAVPEYDCLFDTKRYWDGDAERLVATRRRVYLPHGYDPELHRPVRNGDGDRRRYGCDVSFIGNHSPLKEQLLAGLVALRPRLDLRIYGEWWAERCAGTPLAARVAGSSISGPDYPRAIAASAISLGVMGVVPGARDETSTRTYEIPAVGGFMLHERSEELLTLFDEGREVACFDGAAELAEKIDHYLAHPAEREAIARAGHARCVPAYAYDARMAEIVRWHRGERGGFATGKASDGVVAVETSVTASAGAEA